MRGQELFEKFTNIDDKFIISAQNIPKNKSHFKLVAFAASILILFTSYYHINSTYNRTEETPIDSSLPILMLDTETSGGMGFEGYSVYDIDELVSNNPWNENLNIDYLPAIYNPFSYNNFEIVETPDYELMKSILIETCERLGMNISNLEIQNDGYTQEEKDAEIEMRAIAPPENLDEVPEGFEVITLDDGRVYINIKRYFDLRTFFIEDENYNVSVSTNLVVEIKLKNPIQLPSEYQLNQDSSYEEYLNSAEYLQDDLSSFIPYENPTINISGGYYDTFLEQSYYIGFYNKTNSNTQNILNYNFDYTNIYVFDNEISIIRRYYTDTTNIIADYPIISIEDATNLFYEGKYLTTTPTEYMLNNEIFKTELVYLHSKNYETLIPYYKFYVEIEFINSNSGLTHFGVYYVPAIESAYISNMPDVNQLHFN